MSKFLVFKSLLLSASAFLHSHRLSCRHRRCSIFSALRNQNNQNSGEVGNGPNWIERSFPVDVDESTKVDPKAVIDYDLGISGVSYQVGPLSERMFEAIEARSSILKQGSGASMEVKRGFLIYTLDFTAKEAVKAALKQNGLELVLTDDEQDEGMWSDIDSIKLLDNKGSPLPGKMFDSWEDAVDHWRPGQAFDFVARQVPAKMKELSLEELLQALDPKGELRKQAQDAGMRLPDDSVKNLNDMAGENVRRTEMSPREATAESKAFAGIPEKRGYKVMHASDLLYDSMNADGTENEKVLMHVMDSLANHGCLIVDVTDGGSSFHKATVMASMWNTAQRFFNMSWNDKAQIPPMRTLEEVGSPHAKVGFASYHNGNMEFLETRLDRQGTLFPTEAQAFLGPAGCQSLVDSFSLVAAIGKDIVRVVVGASSREAGVLDGTDAAESALLVANELLDDGKSLAASSTNVEHQEGRVTMSPLRLCLYSNKQQPPSNQQKAKNKSKKQQDDKSKSDDNTREIFGAHTDSTFITAVPVASISGLEVYDEDAAQWYRPELAARKHWQDERAARGLDPNALTETVDGAELPWHARYLVMMPGELLQLCSRQEILAAVHRVVATQDSPSRISAPILLRGRPGIKMNASRYLGGLTLEDLVLQSCDGMTIEEIHDAMQPKSFQ